MNATLLLADLLTLFPQLTAVWIDRTTDPPTLNLQTDAPQTFLPTALPAWTEGLTLKHHTRPPITIALAPTVEHNSANPHQACQNEPIHLGTQIQPAQANWLGTAGAPVRFTDTAGQRRIGILTNHHVVAHDQFIKNRTIHQPTIAYSPIARATLAHPLNDNQPNHLDLALCDAYVNGYHTIAKTILGIGQHNPKPTDLTPGRPVIKSGRTTAVTRAKVLATGVAARVSYGKKTLIFVDQDLIEHTSQPFSAPGDSGSLILTADTLQPAALLFAGSAQQTLANPLRYAIDTYQLNFQI